jgi:hypothetical protein
MKRKIGSLQGAGLAVIALLICARLAAPAQGAQSAQLRVSLNPLRAGASTTISFSFRIGATEGALPAALTQLEVRLPPGMGIDTSGLATCARGSLAHGPQGCSANARVGGGSVKVEVPLGNVTRPEDAALSVFNGIPQDGHTTLVFYAAGHVPIATQLVFVGVVIPSLRGPLIDAPIPLIPTLPDTPDAAIVEMRASLGTLGRSYYRTVAGKRVRFTPKGPTLPARCPAAGLPFSAEFHFDDGSAAAASSTVACPR